MMLLTFLIICLAGFVSVYTSDPVGVIARCVTGNGESRVHVGFLLLRENDIAHASLNGSLS